MNKITSESARVYTARMLKKSSRIHKELGQHFLIDDTVVARIVESIPSQALLLEVGAGLGVMTRHFIGRNPEFWSVELDREKAALLQKEYRGCPLTLLTGDARKIDLATLWNGRRGWVAGNLPYYITNPLIMHFLGQKDFLEAMTIMVQKEVAERICAEPGSKDYGVLSIAVQAAAHPEILFNVSHRAFLPVPKVESAVLTLHIRPHPELTLSDEKTFLRIVKAAFSSRRKMLSNSLSAGLGCDKTEVSRWLRQAEIDETRRAETLSIAEFQRVTEVMLALKDT